MPDILRNSNQLRCDFCGGARLKTLFSSYDRAFDSKTEFAIVQCCKCDLVFTYPRMDKSEFRVYYPPSYPPYTQTVLEEETRLAARIFHALGRRLNPGFLERFPSGKVLDVGCGTGVASRRLLEQGHPVTGIEINHDAADYARNLGIQVINASFDEVELEPNSYSILVMRHSLEHMTDIRATLRKANRLLVPAGNLYVCLPNFASLLSIAFGRHWYSLEIPRHTFHFSLGTLKTVLADAGFRITNVKFDYSSEPHVLARSLDYLTNGNASFLLGKGWRLFHMSLYPLGCLLAAMSMASHMNVYAVKVRDSPNSILRPRQNA